MAKSPDPVVLDLASLPREQMGPFLILGLDKSADKTTIESHWADRIKWARRNLVKVALEDINWARDVLGDVERRIRADAGSLNLDTTDAVLAQLSQRFGLEGGQATRQWQPLDSEKALADYVPAAEVPEIDAVRQGITVPRLPEDVPAVGALLERLVQQPLDPWALELPDDRGRPEKPIHDPKD
jgi:hypothetical protein